MSCRKLKRNIARHNMEKMGVRRINKHYEYGDSKEVTKGSYFSAYWKEHFAKAVSK